jgi:hypothetical protein
MIRGLLFLLLICMASGAYSQGALLQQESRFSTDRLGAISSPTWNTLANVTFEAKEGYMYPKFGERVKALNGKTIEIQGYIFPLEDTRYSTYFMLSALPLSSCFFCGTGGAESIVEVEAKAPVKYSESPIRMKGTLVLNDSDEEK